MTGRLDWVRTFWMAVAIAAWLFAGFIAVDTLRAIVPTWSPLPWFDEWATLDRVRLWLHGEMTAAQVLFGQHNEHRILVPRLVFFADDLLFRGGGYLCLAAIFAVQALHAGLFAAVLARSRPRAAGGWAIAAVVLAMMFGLRQAENFSSAFQLQFVAVFAGATLSFVLFALAARRMHDGDPATWPLIASLGAAALTTFTMANGLLAGDVLVAMALAARLRLRIVLVCAGWAVLLTAIYLDGYSFGSPHVMPPDPLRAFLAYLCTYLGNPFTAHHANQAEVFGAIGLVAAVAAAWRVVRQKGERAGAMAMAGVMLFVIGTAAVTASGRFQYGVDQALSSRYVTGGIAFWAAQLTYWWIDPPLCPPRIGRVRLPRDMPARGAVAVLALVLCVMLAKAQTVNKPDLVRKYFAQAESEDLLLLGLDDPTVVSQAAWSDEDVQRVLPILRDNHLSIFATADYASLGHPITGRGTIGEPCDGAIAAAVEDPKLGGDGVRVAGRALDGRRIVRRILIADAEGNVAGFASGLVLGAPRGAWRGFAVGPVGAALTAYGVTDGSRLCRIGAATVTAPTADADRP